MHEASSSEWLVVSLFSLKPNTCRSIAFKSFVDRCLRCLIFRRLLTFEISWRFIGTLWLLRVIRAALVSTLIAAVAEICFVIELIKFNILGAANFLCHLLFRAWKNPPFKDGLIPFHSFEGKLFFQVL